MRRGERQLARGAGERRVVVDQRPLAADRQLHGVVGEHRHRRCRGGGEEGALPLRPGERADQPEAGPARSHLAEVAEPLRDAHLELALAARAQGDEGALVGAPDRLQRPAEGPPRRREPARQAVAPGLGRGQSELAGSLGHGGGG